MTKSVGQLFKEHAWMMDALEEDFKKLEALKGQEREENSKGDYIAYRQGCEKKLDSVCV